MAAIVWIWEAIVLYRMKTEASAYYEKTVAPRLAAQKRNAEKIRQVESDRAQGKLTPLPEFELADASMLEVTIEAQRRQFSVYENLMYAKLVLMGGAFLLMITAIAQQQLRRRAREAPERPAEKNAGLLVGELVQRNRGFTTAKSPGAAPARQR